MHGGNEGRWRRPGATQKGPALEGAIEDGAVTDRERAVLDRLRDELEVPREVAERLEREMSLAAASPAAGREAAAEEPTES